MRRLVCGLVLAVALAGCIGSAPRDAADAGHAIADPLVATLLINRTVGPPTHQHLRIAEQELAIRDGEQIRLLTSGFGSRLLDMVSAQGFPNPLTFPLDDATYNPVVDGEVRPILAPPSPNVSSWTVRWGEASWAMTRTADGVRGVAETGASWVAAYDEVPWRPDQLRFVNATGVVALNVTSWGSAEVDDGDVVFAPSLTTMASFEGGVDTVDRTVDRTARIAPADGDDPYLWLSLRCRPERARLPAAGQVAFRVRQDGVRAAESCQAPTRPRACLANGAVTFESGDVAFELQHDAGALSEMQARAAIYDIDLTSFEVQGDRVVPKSTGDSGSGQKRLDCVFEDAGGAAVAGLDLV